MFKYFIKALSFESAFIYLQKGGEKLIYVIRGEEIEPLNHIQGLTIEKEVNGTFQLSLTSFNKPNNIAYPMLLEESIVVVDGYEFRIKQLKEIRFGKFITAISTFFDDLNDNRKDDIYGGTRTFREFATWLFLNTDWTFTTDIEESRFIPDFGNANIISLVNTLCSVFECEYEILPNKQVYFTKQIGGNNDYQYRYKHNIVALSKTVDTSNVKTYIEGYGANGLYVSYTSPLADEFGIKKADPIYDDRFTHADSLQEHIKSQLNDVPQVALELDVVELTSRDLGETIWLIYEPLNIELSTRIMKQTLGIVNGRLTTKSVVLGNTLPKNTQDLLVQQKIEIDENKKEFRSKIEQTNDRITLAVEEVGSQIAELNIRADSIELSVSYAESQIALLEMRSDSIELQVSSKVDYSDYTGDKIISRINLAPGTATIQADKINLVGAVSVLSDISGNLGYIYAGNINISQDITVGSNIIMQGYSGEIKLPTNECSISCSGGSVTLEVWNDLDINAKRTYFYGTVDFSYATVQGLPSSGGGGYADTAGYAYNAGSLNGYDSSDFVKVGSGLSNLTLAYSSSSKRIYFRESDMDLGWIDFDNGTIGM